jgi:hypothetical protein
MKKKVLIISYSNLHTDPRVRRQIMALRDEFDVTTAGYTPAKDLNESHISIEKETQWSYQVKFHWKYPIIIRKTISILVKLLKLNILFKNGKSVAHPPQDFEKRYWYYNEYQANIKDFLKNIIKEKYDLILANDIQTLPLTVKYKKYHKDTKIILDAHEYSPKEFENDEKWTIRYQKFYEYICTSYLPKADKIFTVCQGIAEEYATNFNISLPIVITNACNYYDLQPQMIDEKNIKIIHHGIANPSRKIELMIEMMDYLPINYSLDLMLVGEGKYYDSLKLLAQKNPLINFLHPVATNEIASFTNQYDIGLFLLPPSNFNYLYALPNKLFEFVQARLAIAISPSPEMAHIVKKYDLGIVSEDFTAENLAEKIKNTSTDKLNYYKNQSHKFSMELSAEKNKEIIVAVIQELIS